MCFENREKHIPKMKKLWKPSNQNWKNVGFWIFLNFFFLVCLFLILFIKSLYFFFFCLKNSGYCRFWWWWWIGSRSGRRASSRAWKARFVIFFTSFLGLFSHMHVFKIGWHISHYNYYHIYLLLIVLFLFGCVGFWFRKKKAVAGKVATSRWAAWSCNTQLSSLISCVWCVCISRLGNALFKKYMDEETVELFDVNKRITTAHKDGVLCCVVLCLFLLCFCFLLPFGFDASSSYC